MKPLLFAVPHISQMVSGLTNVSLSQDLTQEAGQHLAVMLHQRPFDCDSCSEYSWVLTYFTVVRKSGRLLPRLSFK